MSSSFGSRGGFAGSISEVFHDRSSAVVLMDYDEEQSVRFLSLGPFVVKLVVQTIHPIILTFCSVDGFLWPLTRDTVIIRVAKRSFVITMPGLLYGLQFPKICEETHIDTLGRVFMKFGHYMDLNETSLGYAYDDNEPFLWLKLRPRVEPMAHEMLGRFGYQPGKSRFYMQDHNSCFTRAARMSASTRKITNGITSGTLRAAHISIKGGNQDEKKGGGSSSSKSAAGIYGPEPAEASVSVFSSMIDAAEASWIITSTGFADVIVGAQPPLIQTYPDPGFRFWRLNDMGLVAFLHEFGSATERELEIMREKENRREATVERQRQVGSAKAAAAPDKGKQI